jgi:hypothetical protein
MLDEGPRTVRHEQQRQESPQPPTSELGSATLATLQVSHLKVNFETPRRITDSPGSLHVLHVL